MKALKTKLALFFFPLLILVLGGFSPRSVSLDKPLKLWLDFQHERSKVLLFNNISPQGAARGAVIASPSKANPDYFYHWVRDAGLVMNAVVDLWTDAPTEAARLHYLSVLKDYIAFSRSNQYVSNPSEQFYRPGLGEPKFNADGSTFDKPWMRPQNDGPALRSITLIRIAEELIARREHPEIVHSIYSKEKASESVVKLDLQFLNHVWSNWSFDLWEECRGHHFYTRIVQYKALMDGARLAEKLGDSPSAKEYRKTASLLERALQDHWDARSGKIRESFSENCEYKDTGLDSATILGILHTQGGAGLFAVHDEKLLATAYEIEKAFKAEYPINSVTQNQYGKSLGTAIGRYPKDRYNGYNSDGYGNPWVLTTNAFAEYYYLLSKSYLDQGRIELSPVNHKFFVNLLPRQSLPTSKILSSSDPLFHEIIKALTLKAEAFTERNRYHGLPNGSFSEQIHRDTGHMQGASDLTWNYASFLTMMKSRKQIKRLP